MGRERERASESDIYEEFIYESESCVAVSAHAYIHKTIYNIVPDVLR